jgi:hypothetical protein
VLREAAQRSSDLFEIHIGGWDHREIDFEIELGEPVFEIYLIGCFFQSPKIHIRST